MKKLLHGLSLLKFAYGGLRPLTGPMRAHWNITYKCNSRCRHCNRWHKRTWRDDELNTDEARRVIDQLAELQVGRVCFASNEPLMRDDFFDLIKHARSLSISASLNTNGLAVGDEMADRICEAGPERVSFSLDGHTPEINDHSRGVPGGFEQTFAAIERLKQRRADADPKLLINMVTNRTNIEGVTAIARMCRERGIDEFLVQPIHDVDVFFEPEQELLMRDEDLERLVTEMNKLKAEYPEFLPAIVEYYDHFQRFTQEPDTLYRYKCLAGYANIDILPNGDVVPCPMIERRMGNLREQSAREVWYSKEADETRRMIRSDQHPICWMACFAALNLLVSYLRPTRLYKLLSPRLVKRFLRRI